jgi:hypothetical protein
VNAGRIGGVVGVVVIVAVWWLASLVLFQGSGSIPTPPSVLAKFFDGGQWAATVNNAGSTVTSAAKGYLWGNLARSRSPSWCSWCRGWSRWPTRSRSSPTASRWWRSDRSS